MKLSHDIVDMSLACNKYGYFVFDYKNYDYNSVLQDYAAARLKEDDHIDFINESELDSIEKIKNMMARIIDNPSDSNASDLSAALIDLATEYYRPFFEDDIEERGQFATEVSNDEAGILEMTCRETGESYYIRIR
jgi:hypothetical protein